MLQMFRLGFLRFSLSFRLLTKNWEKTFREHVEVGNIKVKIRQLQLNEDINKRFRSELSMKLTVVAC